jgi:gliding motility-associated-like protein
MKSILAAIGLLFLVTSAAAQNMVHNPSFETYVQCPFMYTDLDPQHVAEWNRPTGGTSDYFNACCTNADPSTSVDVPSNFGGFQNAFDGSAYAGFYNYGLSNYREYIQGNLSPLTPGETYRVSMRVCRIENASYGSNGFGVFFFKDSFTVPNYFALTPQVDFATFGVITDTANWTLLSGTFLADSAYEHLTIGNFRTDANTQNQFFNNAVLGPDAYYYIDSIIVTPVNPIFIATTAFTDVKCYGGSDGTASVTAYNGTPPYSYSWQPGNFTTASITGLSAGTYTCTITDANNATTTQTVTVSQPPLLTVTGVVKNACNNLNSGKITLTVNGGTMPYTYNWSPNVAAGPVASGLAAGTYSCAVSDANGCVVLVSYTVLQSPAITATSSQTNIFCYGQNTGTATVNASGGVPGYTYSWSPFAGNGPTAINQYAGSHTCTITDAYGCTLAVNFNITQPPQITTVKSQTNVNCNSLGTAGLVASGGVAPYQYSWTPIGGNGPSVTGLAVGSYTCTITDANNCTHVDTFNIIQTAAVSATGTQSNVSCYGGNNGSATVNVVGGTPPYTYLWAPSGGNTATALALTAGTYTCTITDNDGCGTTYATTITQPATGMSATTSQVDILCNGANTGSATVNAIGGTPGYTYLWTPSGGNNATANNLTAGNYTCTIHDANSCTLQKTFTLTQPSAVVATTSQTNISCHGAGDGVASVSASGGVPGYTYSWLPSGGNAASASGLSPGTYTCTITDANNCTLQKVFTITEPAQLSATITHTDASCFAGNNGTATVIPSGGTAPYSYSWAPSGGNSATASGLVAGSYTCTITDQNGCTTTQSATIIQPSSPISIISSQSNPACGGAATGVATVIVSGGYPPYAYSWTPIGGNGPNANNLTAGAYTCNVTDANACVIPVAFTITEPPPIVASTSHADILCNGQNNGIATMIITGGVAPYTYAWSPSGGNGPNATGLSAGIYTCTVTDHNNCIYTDTVHIHEAVVLSVADSQTNVRCFGENNGYAQVIVSGGTPPYTYLWSPSGGNAYNAFGLAAGTYTCSIKDYNACIHDEVFNILQPEALSARTTKTNVVCQNLNQGVAIAIGAGGTGPYTYFWTPGNTTDTIISGLGVGKDTCLVTDSNGCTYQVVFNIVDTSQPFSYSVADSDIDCRTALLTAIPASGSSIASIYQWFFSDSASAIGNPAAHTFPQDGNNSTKLIVVNAVGCHDTLTYNFNINDPMLAGFSFDPDPPLANSPVDFKNTSSSFATLYNWDFGDGTTSTEKEPRKYYNDSGSLHICLVASNANNCTDSVCRDVTIDVTKTVAVPSAFSPNGDGDNDILYVRGYRLKTVHLRIYNRWGNLMFETDSKDKGWDGTYKGQPQVAEGYAYTLDATFTDGGVEQKNGSITLIR